MKRFVFAASVAGIASFLSTGITAAHAEWVNDGFTVETSTPHVEGGGGAGVGTSTSGEMVVTASAVGSGAPPPSYWNYCTTQFRQKLLWNGGGTPSTSFTIHASGKLDGHDTHFGSVVTLAKSTVTFPPGTTSTWTYPEQAKTPSGNIPVSAVQGSTTTSFFVTLYAETKGNGGSSSNYGSNSYDEFAEARYKIDPAQNP